VGRPATVQGVDVAPESAKLRPSLPRHLNPHTLMSLDTPPPVAPAKEDTTIALLAYLTPILFGVGIVIAIIMHNSKKTALGAFHLRQSLGLIIASIVIWMAMMVIGFIPVVNMLLLILVPVVWIGFFVLWVMGLISAINAQQKPLPVVGVHFQKWFAGAFN
jgi:uncharacterized membrane protein